MLPHVGIGPRVILGGFCAGQVWSGSPVSHFCSRAELQPLHDTGQVFSSFMSMRLMEEGLPL